MTSSTLKLVPKIDSTALPQTPADEWADSTNEILGAHVVTTPLEAPGPNVPGSFPDEFASITAASGDSTVLDTAKAHLPAEDDLQRAITSAGQTAKGYLPQGLTSYLPSESDAMAPPRPPFASPMSNLSTEAQAGSFQPSTPDSISTLSVSNTAESTAVHTGGSSSESPLATVRSKFVEGVDTPSTLSSPQPLTSSSSILPVASNPNSTSDSSPVLVSSPEAISSSGQSEGVPAPPNSLATTTDSMFSDSPNAISHGFVSSSPEDTFSAPNSSPPARAPHILGSAALNSSASEDNVPAASADSDSDDAGASSPASSYSGDVSDHAGGTAPKQKKPKLVQRMKDKMHVGHAHS